jgi:hypothetical protein
MSSVIWFKQMFQENISCEKLIEIGREIAKDDTLTCNQKFILRQVWRVKYNNCKNGINA